LAVEGFIVVKPLYEFDEKTRELLIFSHLEGNGPTGGTVSPSVEGKFGSTYVISYPDERHGIPVIAKCPKLQSFKDPI
jgi:hypothetical protein